MPNDKMRMTERLRAVMRRVKPGRNIDNAIQIPGLVVVVLESQVTGLRSHFRTRNIVTNDGDLFYAERAVKTTTPTDFVDGSGDFDGIMELYNGASGAPLKTNDRSNLTGLVSGSAKAMDATYPLINDADSDNGGAGADIVTYRVSYATGEANASGIADVIITNPSPGASENLLMHAEFGSAFTKTSSDTLKVFVNHTMNGV